MAKKPTVQNTDPILEALKDILIAQLALAGVAGHEIRSIAGCDMNRVTRMLKPIKKALKARDKIIER